MSTSRPGGTRFALRGNARLAYDPGAPPSASGAASAVVMLHDLLADRGALGSLRDVLAPAHRLIVPDARGHGASATLANRWYSVADLAADLVAILDAEGIAAAHLVGHGLGGTTAFEVARHHPARVRSLTLIEPALSAVLDNDPDPVVASARTALRTNDRAAADDAAKGLTDKALDTYLRPRLGASWQAETTPPHRAAIRRQVGALAGLLLALDAYALDRSEIRRLTTPVLVVVGDDAGSIAAWTASRLGELLPNARVLRLAGSRPGRVEHGATGAALGPPLLAFLASA